MDWTEIVGLLGIGFAAGTFGSMLGGGGGVLVVPFLTLILHLPLHTAIATSFVAIIATSSAAATTCLKSRLVNIRLGLMLELATVAGTVMGALLAVYLHANVLGVIFGGFLLSMGLHMLLRRQSEGLLSLESADDTKQASSLAGSYRDHSSGNLVSYVPNHIPQGLAASLVAGGMSGLLGIGGGIVKVPVMNLVMHVPMKASAATSSYMIGITALSGAIVFFAQGYLMPVTVAFVVIGAGLGGQVGSRLAQRMPVALLKRIFAIVLLGIAIIMVIQGVSGEL